MNTNCITEPLQSRTMYDTESLEKEYILSTGPGKYRLNDKIYNDSCLQPFPGYNTKSYGALAASIDTESDILYTSKSVKNLKVNKTECNNPLIPEFTKDKKSCYIKRELDRFDYIDTEKVMCVQKSDIAGESTRLNKYNKKGLYDMCNCGKYTGKHKYIKCIYE